jgi:hypothetical protein
MPIPTPSLTPVRPVAHVQHLPGGEAFPEGDAYDPALVTDPAREAEALVRRLFAAATSEAEALTALLHPACYFKDQLALTSDLRTLHTSGDVSRGLKTLLPRAGIHDLHLLVDHARAVRHGPFLTVLEAPFEFALAHPAGRAYGIARFIRHSGNWLLWTLYTVLESLDACPEVVPVSAAVVKEVSEYPAVEERPAAMSAKAQPSGLGCTTPHGLPSSDGLYDVVVVGGGQAGLAMIARCKSFGLRACLLDKNARIGDNWRKRYDRVKFHTVKHYGS